MSLSDSNTLNKKILDLIGNQEFTNIDVLSVTSSILVTTCIRMKMCKPHFLAAMSDLYEEVSEFMEKEHGVD